MNNKNRLFTDDNRLTVTGKIYCWLTAASFTAWLIFLALLIRSLIQ